MFSASPTIPGSENNLLYTYVHKNESSYSGKSVDYHVIFPGDMSDVQIPLLQYKSPKHESLILIFEPVYKRQWIMISKYTNRSGGSTQINFEMTQC